MSNFLAVAAVTATLRRFLQEVVSEDVSGAVVTTVKPDDNTTGLPATRVNLFLYLVAPNMAQRNADLPIRRGDGTVSRLPEAAVDLFYLVSCYGDEGQLEPQRLMGSVVRTLHARPIVTRQMVEDTLADPAFSYLAASDLAAAAEPVRLVPLGLTTEELSQLWSGLFFQTDFALTVAYRAAVVLLTAEEETPSPALPVRERQLLVETFRQPLVETVEVEGGGPTAPIVPGVTLVLGGRRLRGDLTHVRLGGLEVEVSPDDVSDTRVRFPLDAPDFPGDQLRAGPVGVQVLHPFLLGDPPQPRAGVQSAVAAFVLRPLVVLTEILSIWDSGGGRVSASVRFTLNPWVGPRQRVNLILNPLPGSGLGESYRFAAVARTADSETVRFPVRDVLPGTYLLRIEVDGAESPLTADDDPASPTFEQFIAPTIDLVLPPPVSGAVAEEEA